MTTPDTPAKTPIPAPRGPEDPREPGLRVCDCCKRKAAK